MITFFLMVNKQGKTRISKYYNGIALADRPALEKAAFTLAHTRDPKFSNFCPLSLAPDYDGGDGIMLIYHRYVGLYVMMGIEEGDNMIMAHEGIHLFVEMLDMYFGCVRELDIIYHFQSVYNLLDEYICAGHIIETSKEHIMRRMEELEIAQGLRKKKKKSIFSRSR